MENNCYFCDKEVKFDDKHREHYPNSRRVNGKEESVLIRDSVLQRCEERKDALASTVRTQLGNVRDLVAEEAVYHNTCHVQFYNNDREGEKSKGRPENRFMQDVFDRICHWLENENKINFSLKDIEEKMQELSEGEQVYGTKRVQQKLQEVQGQCISR